MQLNVTVPRWLVRLQGQFLLQQKVLIFFYKIKFAQKVYLLFSYFVAVTVSASVRPGSGPD